MTAKQSKTDRKIADRGEVDEVAETSLGPVREGRIVLPDDIESAFCADEVPEAPVWVLDKRTGVEVAVPAGDNPPYTTAWATACDWVLSGRPDWKNIRFPALVAEEAELVRIGYPPESAHDIVWEAAVEESRQTKLVRHFTTWVGGLSPDGGNSLVDEARQSASVLQAVAGVVGNMMDQADLDEYLQADADGVASPDVNYTLDGDDEPFPESSWVNGIATAAEEMAKRLAAAAEASAAEETLYLVRLKRTSRRNGDELHVIVGRGGAEAVAAGMRNRLKKRSLALRDMKRVTVREIATVPKDMAGDVAAGMARLIRMVRGEV